MPLAESITGFPNKLKYLSGYNDETMAHDVELIVSNTINSTIAISQYLLAAHFARLEGKSPVDSSEEEKLAEMVGNFIGEEEEEEEDDEDQEETDYKIVIPKIDLPQLDWPSAEEFSIFNVLPRIDEFLIARFAWLQDWQHSIDYKCLLIDKHGDYHIYEVNFAKCRISYPVAQATFSFFFIVEVSSLLRKDCPCRVRYYLEGGDEEYVPYAKDDLNFNQIKSVMKKKLGFYSSICIGCFKPKEVDTEFFNTCEKYMERKEKLMNELCMLQNICPASRIKQRIPLAAQIVQRRYCEIHDKDCKYLHPCNPDTITEHYSFVSMYDEEFGEVEQETTELKPSSSIYSSSILSDDSFLSKYLAEFSLYNSLESIKLNVESEDIESLSMPRKESESLWQLANSTEVLKPSFEDESSPIVEEI